MSHQGSGPDESGESHNVSENPGAARRRLLKGGLAGAPVLMTLISRPVLGAQCLSPSAFGSGNVSHPNQGQPCLGVTPGYWKNHTSDWPAAIPTAMMFHPFFGGNQYSGQTMLQVLNDGGGPPNDVGRHIVAALLNAAKGWNVAPDQTAVRNIWNEYAQSGYFEPTAGVHWDHTQIVAYLTSTMPL